MNACRDALAIIVLSALVGACAAPRMDAPVNENWQARSNVLAAITNWEFTGRIGVRDEHEAHSSSIRWQQREEEYVINLWGTLNAGATQITGSPTLVTLQQQGKAALMAATPEQLVAEQLGYELPVLQLRYWIKGILAPGSVGTPSFNEENHLIALQQDGWTVQYMAYTNYDTESLPTRIRIEKSPLRLDFVRLNWTLQP